jgi:SAM-dependent methyltransferase
MSLADRTRWNEKWGQYGENRWRPHPLLRQYERLLAGGAAVDVACGRGQNSLWLAQRGYRTLGVDLSEVALRQGRQTAVAQQLDSQISFVQTDLDYWRPAPASCDLIVVFRFLERRLFPHLRAALRPGGLIFYETRCLGLCEREPEANPDYLLKPGELVGYFQDWQILHARETAVQSELVARQPDKREP